MTKNWWEKLDRSFSYLFSDLFGGEKMANEKEYVDVNAQTYRGVIADGVVILEPSATYDKGVVGYNPKEKKLIYALSLLINALVEDNDWEYEEAVDWLHYNTIRACEYQENAPIILEDIYADE